MRRLRSAAGLLACALASGACGGSDHVLRVVNGRVVEGNYVEPEAYAAFLRGAIAESAGDAKGALASYEEAARLDDEDPEIWTRIGEVRCRNEGAARDATADAALNRATRMDPAYAPAWSARARCAIARGDAAVAAEAAARAAEADPLAIEPDALLARAQRAERAGVRSETTRRRLMAVTMFHADRPEAWDALGAWAASHGDVPLHALAMERLAALAPSRAAQIAAAARGLAGAGEIAAARRVAGALVDAGVAHGAADAGAAVAGARDAADAGGAMLVARLAVDAALVAGDAERARLRTTRAHLGLDTVAARALLLGDASLARALAQPLADADPHAAGARAVIACADIEQGRGARTLRQLEIGRGPLSAEVLLVFARALARATTAEAARAFVERAVAEPLVPHDALTTSLAVDLAARGIFDANALPLDGQIELAARRGEAPPAAALAMPPEAPSSASPHGASSGRLRGASSGSPDARHALLALALAEPRSPRAQDLARLLAPLADRDALIATAFARLALAGAAPARDLARFDPADPLVAAVAYDLAVRAGNSGAIPVARARLAAVARTPAERARVE